MSSTKIKANPTVLKAVEASASDNTMVKIWQPQSNIIVYFMVALAVRKFQNLESNKFKKSLIHHIDKQACLEKIRHLCDADQQFLLEQSVELAYLIRKFDLTFQDINFQLVKNILRCLQNILIKDTNNASNMTPLNFLCMSLKFLTQNSNNDCVTMTMSLQHISCIIKLLEKGHVTSDIRKTLTSFLMVWFEKQNEEQSSKDNTDLIASILHLPDLSVDVKTYFRTLSEYNNLGSSETKENVAKSMTIQRVKKNQQVVSRTMQTVKSKQESKTSEEADFLFINLSDSMKHRKKKINCNTNLCDEPEEQSETGSDRSMFRSTWGETVYLYAKVSQGNTLKDDDKDNYLPGTLFGLKFILPSKLSIFNEKRVYPFFIDRMCTAMFLQVSRKQHLNSEAIEKLLKCIVDFNGLVSLLGLGKNYVRMFVDFTFDRYWEVKKLDSPDIAVTFFNKCIRETTEEYVEQGWFYDSTKVKRKPYDQTIIEKLVIDEINCLRSNAVKAIYNCALRNKKEVLTELRLEKLQTYIKNQDAHPYANQTLVEYIIKLIGLAEELEDFDYKSTFQMYIDQLQNNSASLQTDTINSMLTYMDNQARDMQRSQELFTEEILEIVIDCLSNLHQQRVAILEIVNVLLEHESSKWLSRKNLKRIVTICTQPNITTENNCNNDTVIKSCLTIFLLSTDKKQSISTDMLEELKRIFNAMIYSEDCTSFIVFILSRVFCADHGFECNRSHLSDCNFVELVSGKLFSDHTVQLNDDDGERVRFEKITDHSHCSNQIALMAAKIIYRSVEGRVILSSVTIDNLILLLNKGDKHNKQTRIITAKCLYGFTKYKRFPRGDHLNQLYDLINNSIYDVGVYVQTAYIKGCEKVAYSSLPAHLDSVHLENISSLYVTDSLKLGTVDFEQEINKSVFQTFLYESRKSQEFHDANVFLLFNNILNLNERYVSDVLEILCVYTLKYIVPEATVNALENLLDVSGYFNQSIQVLQNIIRGGKLSVTSKTLCVFTDYLQSSADSRLRFNSFKLLSQVSENQDIPDKVFHPLELVKASYALQRCHHHESKEKQMILEYIQKLVDKGVHLPIDTMQALQCEVYNLSVLEILATASKNRQIIDQHLLDILIELFKQKNPTSDDIKVKIILVTIFKNAAKNNQKLPPQLIVKLEEALQHSDLEHIVLPVFTYLAQKGEKLSLSVIEKLLDKLLKEEDPVMKQELLSSLGSLIQANKEHIDKYQSQIQAILAKEITSRNHNIQKLCISSVVKFVGATGKVDDVLLDKLVLVGTSPDSSNTIKREIQRLFKDVLQDSCNPSINAKKQKIRLANLSCNSPESYLQHLSSFVDIDGGFLTQNYNQLKDILDSGSEQLQEETLNLLRDCRSHESVTDDFLDSVAVLYQSTMSEKLRNSCLQLINKANDSEKKLTGRVREIHSCMFKESQNIKQFSMSHLCDELKQQLSEETVLDLLTLIQNNSKLCRLETTTDLINLIVEENSSFPKDTSFIQLIENCLLRGSSLEISLPCYCRIIKEEQKCNVDCVATLVQHSFITKDKTQNLQAALFECMYYTRKFTHLPDVCMSYVWDNIDNDDYVIRGYSFGILKAAATEEVQYQNSFEKLCNVLMENLIQNSKVDIRMFKDKLDLLEYVISVQFLDLPIFAKEESVWKRELLISDIFERLQVSYLEQIQFYQNWFVIEEMFKYHKSCKILFLIQKCNVHSFSQIHELIQMVQEFTFDEVERLLIIYSPDPFQAIKQEWALSQLRSCLTEQNVRVEYIRKLNEKLCYSFDVKFIIKIFRCLKRIDNLCKFEELINFCLCEKIDLNHMLDDDVVQLNNLRDLIEAKYLCRCVKSQPSKPEEGVFLKIFQHLKSEKWDFHQVRKLVQLFKENTNHFQNALHFFNTLKAYRISPSYFEEIKHQILLTSKTFPEIMQKLNTLAIENLFQLEGKEKDLHELIAELQKSNDFDEDLKEFIRTLNINKQIFESQSDKFSWNEIQIKRWAVIVKAQMLNFSDYEAIAVIYQGNFLTTGHRLTHTQILCCLIALRKGKLTSKLLQVATGEGKSTIICILAIINVLRGQKVDIITSSPVLAERDAKQKTKLYRMFTLSCTDNRDKTIYLKGKKDCYLADIVYGEMSQFQFDILRDHYSKLDTLGGRPFMTAIVDEVDSMLIDDSSKIARLSSTVPGMDHFQAIYFFIWQYLISIKGRFIIFNKEMYFVDGKVGFENGKYTLEVINDADGNIVKIPDLEAYIVIEKNTTRFIEVVEDMDAYLNKSVKLYLNRQMKENQIYIPSNFTEFVEKQKEKWITNAIEALNYQENVHYVVQDGEIRPVDYYSTGIVQSSTSWSNGLHQFLQLKHNLKMTCETRTTNFLSNIGFISKYQQVFGLTGTLGSNTARMVLRDVYKAALIDIPSRRKRQFFELSSIIAEGESNWLNDIMSNVILEVKKNRGILVICETIEHANQISGMLKQKLRSSSIKLYVMNDMDQERNVETIQPCEVIIATNLAGRGTDIQTDKIEETGGLHVILTFLPSNQRVEDQAFGRTARQGKRGTGIMILNTENLADTRKDRNGVKIERDMLESEQLKEFRKRELRLIQIKDKLFDRFCIFLHKEIRIRIRQENTSRVRKIVNLLIETNPSLEEICTLAAVEEQWASFLGKLDEGEITCEDAEAEYKKLTDQLVKDYENKDVIKNPYYYITIANDILVNEWDLLRSSAKVKRALKYYKQAINLEGEYWKREKEKKKLSLKEDDQSSSAEDDFDLYSPGAAHLGVAWCITLLKDDKEYKQNVLVSLNMAIKCLTQEMSVLNAAQLLLKERQVGFLNSDLYKQMNTKATILGSYMRGIDNCIDAIKRSLRLINVVSIESHKKDGTTLETGTYFDEQERKQVEAIVNKNLKYSLEFQHLTRREDSGTLDQALTTLENAYDTSKNSKFRGLHCLDVNSDNVRIHLNRVDFATVRSALFNPNKEFNDLTRESAINKLKEQRSYKHTFRVGKSLSTQLEIHSDDKREVYKDKQMNELINIIKDQEISDTSLRFDIVIRDGNVNEINKFLTSHQNTLQSPLNNRRPSSQISFQLHLTFDKLDQENVKAKLNMIRAKSFNIKFVLDKLALLKLIEKNTNLKSAVLFHSDNEGYDKLERQQLLKELEMLERNETPCCIQFDNLSANQVTQIMNSCNKTVAFEICLKNSDGCFDNDLEPGPSIITFDKINEQSGKVVIDLLRKHNFEFSLEFYNLLKSNVLLILKHADLDQEDLDVMKAKTIRDLFMKNSPPTLELNEYISRGIEFIIVINEKEFVPWRSVCAVAALGTGQVILGGCLMVTGFGTSAGMGVITEGITDMIGAYRIYSTRRFQWNDYCAQKAVSLAISAVSMGMSNMKEAAKGIETVTTGVAKEVLEQSGTQLIVSGKTVATTLKKTCVNLKSLTRKFVGVKIAEAVSREVLNTGVQQISNFAFNRLRPSICASVQSDVRRSFDNPDLKYLLYKMHAIDLATDSKHLQSRIEQMVSDIIKHDTMTTLWNSIGLPLIKGILSDSSYYGKTATMAFRVAGTLNGLKQTVTITDTIVKELTKKLSLIDRNTMTITLVLHTQLKISKNNSGTIVNKLKKHGIFNEHDNFPEENIDKNKFKRCRDYMLKECEDNDESMKNDTYKSIDFVERFHEEFIKIEMDSFSEIMKVVSDKISEQLVNIMDSQMLQPWSSCAVSGLVDSVSKRIQHSCLVDKEQNSDSHNVDQEKYEELSKKDHLTTDDKAFLANYGKYRTFSEQLNYNSKDYCLAYKQCEKRVKERAINLQQGAPASLAEMIAIAEENGVNLKLVDNKDYCLTAEDRENGVTVLSVERVEHEIKQVCYMDDHGHFVDAKADNNTHDCVFNVFSNILEKKGIYKSHADLRAETTQHILSNSINFSKILAAENWVRLHHPHRANDLLMTAGLCQNLRTDDLELDLGNRNALINGIDGIINNGGQHKDAFKVT